jgi:hypothetical protein
VGVVAGAGVGVLAGAGVDVSAGAGVGKLAAAGVLAGAGVGVLAGAGVGVMAAVGVLAGARVGVAATGEAVVALAVCITFTVKDASTVSEAPAAIVDERVPVPFTLLGITVRTCCPTAELVGIVTDSVIVPPEDVRPAGIRVADPSQAS